MSPTPPPNTYTSTLSILYPPYTPLNTLDLHTLTTSPHHPSYNLLYIHGGAFRDPLTTSLSLLPSLPSIFNTHHIAQIASLNYRLSPYPSHPTHPSSPSDPSRNVTWPTHISDIRSAIHHLQTQCDWAGKEWMICGHSVGGTMAMMVALQPPPSNETPPPLGTEAANADIDFIDLKAAIPIAGIFNFVACRDAHPALESVYSTFITAAFGPEEAGGWERGNVVRSCDRGGKVKGSVDVVLVVHSRGDEMVEWEQAVRMCGALRREGRGGVGVLVEVEGRHEGVVEEGRVVGEVVRRAVGMLRERLG